MNFILKNAKLSFLALIIGFSFSACDEEDDFIFDNDTVVTPTPDPDPDPDPDPTDDGSSETNTIIDYADANGYSSFVAAVEAADLTATLSGDDEFTVFIPTNDAFAAFLSDNGFAELGDVPVDVLRLVLLNHVQSGSIMAGSLATGYLTSMAEAGPDGEMLSLYVNVDNGVMLNGISTVTSADIEVDNGVIHEVDAVIGLPDVTTFAVADPNFSTLAAGLIDEELVATLQSTDSPAPFTIFAPTDDAFVNFLADLGVDSLADIESSTLGEVLTYHVITDNNVTSDELTDGMMVTTLQGQDITIVVDSGVSITDATGGTSTVLVPDVQATNGVIHAVDAVLMPDLDAE